MASLDRAIHRAIIRARSALVQTRTEEAARATLQMRRLVENQSHGVADCYLALLRMLQACLLAAEDQFDDARTILLSARAAAAVRPGAYRHIDGRYPAAEYQGVFGPVERRQLFSQDIKRRIVATRIQGGIKLVPQRRPECSDCFKSKIAGLNDRRGNSIEIVFPLLA